MKFQEKYIIGYQYSPVDGKFIGEYKFPNNKDSEEIHLPPNTTLQPPPEVALGKAKVLFWREQEWVVGDNPEYKLIDVQRIDDYSLYEQWFIDMLIENEQWTEADQQKLEADRSAKAEREEISRKIAAGEIDPITLEPIVPTEPTSIPEEPTELSETGK